VPTYGQIPRSELPADAPGVRLDFRLGGEHDGAAELAPDRAPRSWTVIPLSVAERFHPFGDVRGESDLGGNFEAMDKVQLDYTHPKPLPVPHLAQIERLEISGLASDLHHNNSVVVALSTDGHRFRDVAVIRDDTYGGRPRPFHHTLERSLLDGEKLWIRVKVRILPQMIADREYLQLPRIGLRYTLRKP
jgi:hypothetical protein